MLSYGHYTLNLMCDLSGLGEDDLFRLAQGAVEFVFADDQVKKSLRAVFEHAAVERLAM